MLSGEGNAAERWKTTIGLMKSGKKQLCTCSTLFLYISLLSFCTTTTWSSQKLFSYTFFGGNVRVFVHLFFTAAHFYLALVAASIFHFVTAATKFSCRSSKKNVSFVLFSRWASLSCCLLSVFLCLSLALFSKFGTWQLNLNLIL